MKKVECVLDLGFLRIWDIENHHFFRPGYYWEEQASTYGSGPFSSIYEALTAYEEEVKKKREKQPALAVVPNDNNLVSVDFNAKVRVRETT